MLSTYGSGQPYASLVAFVATDDLRNILFATPRATRKYANFSEVQRVSLLVDNRANSERDFSEAAAATALGTAAEIIGDELEPLERLYLAKHPSLRDFVASPSCALIKVTVHSYYLVTRFQQVEELHLKP